MRKSSCVVQGFVIMVLIVAAAYGLRQCSSVAPLLGQSTSSQANVRDGIRGWFKLPTATPEAAGTPLLVEPDILPQGDEEETSGGVSDWIARVLGRATPTSIQPTVVSHTIQGLIIRDRRPLTLPDVQVTGMATNARFMFLAVSVPPDDIPMIYRFDQDLYRALQVRELPGGAGARPGALSMGAEHLWLVMSMPDADDETMILEIVPETLAVTQQFTVPVAVGTVAEVGGKLVTFAESGTRAYRWTKDGVLQEEKETAQHVRYGSVEVLGGSLICTGIDLATQRGVLDIVDAASLSTIRRHQGDAVADDGSPLLSKPAGVSGERFQFLSGQGKNPMVATYVLNGVTIEQYVPQVSGD